MLYNMCNRDRDAITCEVRPMISRSIAPLLFFSSFFLLFAYRAAGAPMPPIPPAKVDVPLASAPGKQTAVFAGGCFWGTQAVFERLKGVVDTTVGYSGGS